MLGGMAWVAIVSLAILVIYLLDRVFVLKAEVRALRSEHKELRQWVAGIAAAAAQHEEDCENAKDEAA